MKVETPAAAAAGGAPPQGDRRSRKGGHPLRKPHCEEGSRATPRPSSSAPPGGSKGERGRKRSGRDSRESSPETAPRCAKGGGAGGKDDPRVAAGTGCGEKVKVAPCRSHLHLLSVCTEHGSVQRRTCNKLREGCGDQAPHVASPIGSTIKQFLVQRYLPRGEGAIRYRYDTKKKETVSARMRVARVRARVACLDFGHPPLGRAAPASVVCRAAGQGRQRPTVVDAAKRRRAGVL